DEFIRFFQSRMTFLTTHLEGSGVGSVSPVTADELCEYIRVAYDPAASTLVEDARAAGESLHLDWEDTGPSAYDAEWDYFKHDSGTSVSWVMSQAPQIGRASWRERDWSSDVCSSDLQFRR